MTSLTIENYVKTIYLIFIGQQQPVATGQLADALGVAPGTVTSIAKTLSESGLAIYKPYGGLQLTPAGHRLAMRIIRRHRLIETFLVQTLKLNWDEVHDEAENMEHQERSAEQREQQQRVEDAVTQKRARRRQS